MKTNDGGPAFPSQPLGSDALPQCEAHIGLSLRDYFAAAAMQAVAPQLVAEGTMADFAKLCYEAADAMIDARTRTPEGK